MQCGVKQSQLLDFVQCCCIDTLHRDSYFTITFTWLMMTCVRIVSCDQWLSTCSLVGHSLNFVVPLPSREPRATNPTQVNIFFKKEPTLVPPFLVGNGGLLAYVLVATEDNRSVDESLYERCSTCYVTLFRSTELALNPVSLLVTRRFCPFPSEGSMVFAFLIVR